MVVDDVRLESEAALIRLMGGPVIEIRDPSAVAPTDSHPTEAGVRADEVVISDRALGLHTMTDSLALALVIMSMSYA